jgi:hypothetical protein
MRPSQRSRVRRDSAGGTERLAQPDEDDDPGQEREGRHDVDRRGHAEPVCDESRKVRATVYPRPRHRR